MDRTEFKKRMQSLKSYRENNPGKGYWDWKVEQFQDGGDNPPMWLEEPYQGPTYDQVLQSLKQDNRNTYNRLAEATARARRPTSEIVHYIDANGKVNTVGNASGLTEVYPEFDLLLGAKGIISTYHNSPRVIGKLSRVKVNGENTVQLQGKPFGQYIGEGSEQFVVQSSDDASRVMKVYSDIGYNTKKEAKKAAKEYLKRNKIPYSEKVSHEGYVRDAEGKLYNVFSQRKLQTVNADTRDLGDLERKVLTPVMDEMMRKKGYSGTFIYGYNKGTRYIGDVQPYNIGFTNRGELRFIDAIPEGFEEGGEVPPDNSPVHVNPFTKKPLANGAITPVLDLEGAANFTPAGDVLSIRDAYVAAKNNDLLGLGLAGLGFLPFVPRIGRSKVSKVNRPPIPEELFSRIDGES